VIHVKEKKKIFNESMTRHKNIVNAQLWAVFWEACYGILDNQLFFVVVKRAITKSNGKIGSILY